MKKVRWIVQSNNYAEHDRLQIIKACKQLELPSIEVKIVPFSEELPPFPIDDEHENIYYGSTTMMNRVYLNFNQPLGLFYDEATFSMKNYLEQWGEHMLSSEAEFMTFGEFSALNHPSNKEFFIRPDADSKSFAGTVMEFGKIREWCANLEKEKSVELSPDTKIMAGPAYHIEKEWRNFIVNGKVVTSSAYRKNFELYKSAKDIPAEMIAYVEARCREYQPHDVFVMDVAKCSDEHEYYIIECGCMNSVGFYHADIFRYVEALSEYVENIS